VETEFRPCAELGPAGDEEGGTAWAGGRREGRRGVYGEWGEGGLGVVGIGNWGVGVLVCFGLPWFALVCLGSIWDGWVDGYCTD